jgi:hypothetical protein
METKYVANLVSAEYMTEKYPSLAKGRDMTDPAERDFVVAKAENTIANNKAINYSNNVNPLGKKKSTTVDAVDTVEKEAFDFDIFGFKDIGKGSKTYYRKLEAKKQKKEDEHYLGNKKDGWRKTTSGNKYRLGSPMWKKYELEYRE